MRNLEEYFASGTTRSPMRGTHVEGKGEKEQEEEMEKKEDGFAVDLSAIKDNRRKKTTAASQRAKRSKGAASKKQSQATAETTAGASKGKVKAKTSTKFADAAKKQAPSHNYMAVVGFAIRVGKGKETWKAFKKKWGDALNFLRMEIDEGACILPKDMGSGGLPIVNGAGFPGYQATARKQYLAIPNKYAFTQVKGEGGRTVKGFCQMGFEEEPKGVLELAEGDLRDMGCIIYYKPHQAMDTLQEYALLGVPNTYEAQRVKAIADTELKRLETVMQVDDPENFPLYRDQGQRGWMKFEVIKDWPEGMPWENDGDSRKKREPNGRLCFQFIVKTEHNQRFESLLAAAKDRDMWRAPFGKYAHTIKMPPRDVPEEELFTEGELANYIQCIMNHGSIQLSYGATDIAGLYNAEESVTLRRLPGLRDEDRTPIIKNVRDVMMAMEVEGEDMWVSLLKSTKGKYTGHFSGVMPAIQAHVTQWAEAPAANIYWYLLKHGCVKADVIKLIKQSFTIDEQRKVTNSRWSNSRKMAVIDDTATNSILARIRQANGKSIDLSLGLSDKEKAQYMAKYDTTNTISFAQAQAGAVEAHDFSSGLSIRSISGRKAGRDDAKSVGGKTVNEDVYSVGMDTCDLRSRLGDLADDLNEEVYDDDDLEVANEEDMAVELADGTRWTGTKPMRVGRNRKKEGELVDTPENSSSGSSGEEGSSAPAATAARSPNEKIAAHAAAAQISLEEAARREACRDANIQSLNRRHTSRLAQAAYHPSPQPPVPDEEEGSEEDEEMENKSEKMNKDDEKSDGDDGKDGDMEGTLEKDDKDEEEVFQDAIDGSSNTGGPQVLIEGMDTIEKDMEQKMKLAQDDLDMDSKDMALDEVDDDDEDEMVDGMNSQRLFIEPQNFREQLWNETGPSAQNMATVCGVLIREYKLKEGSKERDDAQTNNDYISTSLRMWLNCEAGPEMDDQVRFLDQAREDVQQIGQEEDSLVTPTGSENERSDRDQEEEEEGAKEEGEEEVEDETGVELEKRYKMRQRMKLPPRIRRRRRHRPTALGPWTLHRMQSLHLQQTLQVRDK
jgi:hypothetical protein